MFTSETTGSPYTVESARIVVLLIYRLTVLPSMSTGVLTLKVWVLREASSLLTVVLPVVEKMPSPL